MVEEAIPLAEKLRRHEIRSHFLVPLHIFWTPDVSPDLAEAAKQGVIDALLASGQKRQIYIFGSSQDNGIPYGSTEWYVHEANRNQTIHHDSGFGPQLDVDEILKLFLREPMQQNPHWEVFLVNQDLMFKAGDGIHMNQCYGLTYPKFAASIQSVRKIEAEVHDPELQKAMFRRLMRHEAGHMFGLTTRTFQVDKTLGDHCANVCAMRGGITTEDLMRETKEERDAGVQFCNDCLQELSQYQSRYHPLE